MNKNEMDGIPRYQYLYKQVIDDKFQYDLEAVFLEILENQEEGYHYDLFFDPETEEFSTEGHLLEDETRTIENVAGKQINAAFWSQDFIEPETHKEDLGDYEDPYPKRARDLLFSEEGTNIRDGLIDFINEYYDKDSGDYYYYSSSPPKSESNQMSEKVDKILKEINSLDNTELGVLIKHLNEEENNSHYNFLRKKIREEGEFDVAEEISKLKNYTKEDWLNMVKQGDILDVVKIEGILYTMDNYDMEGREISYANKSTRTGFTITTSDRYSSSKFFDAIIEYEEDVPIRNDITYYN